MGERLVADVVDAASLGEVGWVDATAGPRAAGVLPLLWQGTPVLALTLDRSELAASLAGAEGVDLLVRDPRNTGRRWQPAGWRCRSRLVEDLDGETYRDDLVLQELRRYPPARRYADSPLLMRENWWYLPRLLVVLEPVEVLPTPGPAGDADELLLVTPDDGRPATAGIRREGDRLVHHWGPKPQPGPGVVLGQDATFPDLEVWTAWTRPVEVGDGRVVPTAPLPAPSPVRPPGLVARWRAERQFSAGCRRGLAAWRS